MKSSIRTPLNVVAVLLALCLVHCRPTQQPRQPGYLYSSITGAETHSPDISANGLHVAFVNVTDNPDFFDTVVVNPFVGGAYYQVGGDFPEHPAHDYEPSIADAGLRVAFTRVPADGSPTQVFRSEFGGSYLADYSEIVTTSSFGVPANDSSYAPAISDDGRFIVFTSEASNLVANDNNGTSDVFLYEWETGAITLVSVSSEGVQGNGPSGESAISADGRYIAFSSSASNLVSGDTNGVSDVFLHSVDTGETSRISLHEDGSEANAPSDSPSISADGNRIAFRTDAELVVDGGDAPINHDSAIALHDRNAGTVQEVSSDLAGDPGTGEPFDEVKVDPSISPDGRYVAYEHVVTEPSYNGLWSQPTVFIFDTTKVTFAAGFKNACVTVQGALTAPCTQPTMSNIGVAFTTDQQLAAGDDDDQDDIVLMYPYQWKRVL